MKNIPNLRFFKFVNQWNHTNLGNVSDIIGGGTPSTSISEYWNGNIKWFSPVEIGNSIFVIESTKTITEKGLKNSSAKILPIGTILFTSRAGIGNTAILAEPASTNQGFQNIVPNRDELDTYFIYSFSDELKKYGEKHGAGSTFLEVSGKQMAKMPIMIPELPEQQSIGSLFHTLDDLLLSYKENLANYQAYKATMLSKMFPKEGEKEPEIRLDGFDDNWKECIFSKIVTRINKTSNSDKLPKVEFEDIISNEGRLNKDISNKLDNRKGTLFEPGFILYGKLRPYLNNWLNPNFKGIALGDFWVFSPNENDSKFIYYLIQSNKYQKVANDTSGTKMPRSDWKSVSSTVFEIPCLEEQRAIGQFFSILDDIISSFQVKISELENLKKKLLKEMFI